MMHTNSARARRIVAGNAIAAAALLAGCTQNLTQDLLRPSTPDVETPASVQSAAGADAARIGALTRLRNITAGGVAQGEGAWFFGGLLTDEWKSGDTFFQRNETDQRTVQTSNADVQAMLRELYRARTNAREALNALVVYKPLPASNVAQMWFQIGYAELLLAETFCNGTPLGDASTGVPVFGPPLSNAQIYTLAVAHFDTALTLTTATDTETVLMKNALLVARGRALINLARYTDAVAAVGTVPTIFQMNQTFSLTTQDNQIWALNTSGKRYVVGDSVDPAGIIGNAIPFASLNDPRVPVVGSSTGTSAAGLSFDGTTNFVRQTIWGRDDPAPIVSGIDARLIEGEAQLNASNFIGMVATLNTLRGATHNIGGITTPVMAPIATVPVTQAAAIDLFFREKALWTFGRGQRLGDLRRIIRIYLRTQDQVFPTGTFFKGGAMGVDVNFPITDDELNNPLFLRCTDRNA
jgi:hypothetical protein